MVNDPALTYNGRDAAGEHQFNHDDIFRDIELRRRSSAYKTDDFCRFYMEVIKGVDPLDNPFPRAGINSVIENFTFFQAVQCLAVAEHRRYARYENKFGGRYLPFRFSAGIAEGLWTANDAAATARKGRPGVELLEKTHGVPKLTQELMRNV